MSIRMRYKQVLFRSVGRSGLKLPEIGLGTWKFGYPERGDGSRTDERSSLGILDRAFELGVTFWDTADRYNNMSGNSERIIGKWLAANAEQRGNVIIGTKVGGMMDGVTPNHQGLSRHHILEGVRQSLGRLQTDYIDLYQWHLSDPETPLDESLRTMDDLVHRGLVRYIGVSNHSVANLEAILELSDRLLLERIVSVQNSYNLADGESEGRAGVVSFCDKHNLGIIPYSPLAQGLLTGRYLQGRIPQTGDRLYDEGTADSRITPRTLSIVGALGEVAERHGKTHSQVALAWLLHHTAVCTVIPTARTVEQLEENAGASGFELTDEEFLQLSLAARNTQP